jgi:hypothetical protein
MTAPALDPAGLRLLLRIGGLDISEERAARALPVVRALLEGCDRVAALGLDLPGGSGMAGPPGRGP